MLIFSAELVFGPGIHACQLTLRGEGSAHQSYRTDCANDTSSAELRGRVVLGVETGEPLDTSTTVFLVEQGVTHCGGWVVDVSFEEFGDMTSESKLSGLGGGGCEGGSDQVLY
jgi:hypothetical protein